MVLPPLRRVNAGGRRFNHRRFNRRRFNHRRFNRRRFNRRGRAALQRREKESQIDPGFSPVVRISPRARRSFLPPPQRRLRQPVRLRILFPPHMRNRKCQRPRQFPAGPVQRVQPRAAARVLPRHLPHHHFRV